MDETAPQSPGWTRWLLVGLIALLVGSSFWVRVDRGNKVVAEGAILFRDNDTVRRLARLEALAEPENTYPYRNPLDGAPEGTVIHWTLPMDWVIKALDPLVSWGYPQAKRFEAGAIWADVLLGTVSVLLFALLAMRWLGPWVGLLASVLYAFSFPAVHVTLYGVGDHQALQHLCLVVALLGFCCLLWRRAGVRMAWAVGAALGMAMWVSTESGIALYLMCLGAFAHLVLLERAERPDAVRTHLRWTAACLVVAFIGDRFEHPGDLLTFEWDQVSGFWLYQILVFGTFLGLLWWLGPGIVGRFNGPLISATLSVVLGVGMLFVTGLNTALAEQMELFDGANRWTQNTVEEYRSLIVVFDEFIPLMAVFQLNWLILGIPLWIVGCALNRRSELEVRAPVLGMTVGLLAFSCLEMKVSHLFVLLYPWLLITGGRWWIERFAEWLKIGAAPERVLASALGVGAIVPLFLMLPVKQEGLTQTQEDVRELTEALIELRAENPGDEMSSVLAHWHWGAKVMYYAGAPVVASGYHRNLAGIEDSYRVLAGRTWEDFESILRKRKVRWIVSVADHAVYLESHLVVPSLDLLMRTVNVRLNMETGKVNADLAMVKGVYEGEPFYPADLTLQAYLTTWRPGTQGDPHFELAYSSKFERQERHPDGTLFTQPVYRIWRVVYPEEQ